MVKNKKSMMAIAFVTGAAILATTAFADVTTKSGYEQFKDAIKVTTASLDGKVQSFTMETTFTLKDNGKVLMTESNKEKLDIAGGMNESLSTSQQQGRDNRSHYSYRDSKTQIWQSSDSDVYNVTEYANERKDVNYFNDPFKEDAAKDVEKIIDAVVGNLRDYVVLEEKTDGTKELSGSLSEAQIPALVNAVSSFYMKQAFGRNSYGSDGKLMPVMVDDIFVKEITGNAKVTADGLIESVMGSGLLSGKDEDGNTHDLTVEALIKIYDVNSTKIAKPDLTGKKVEKHIDNYTDSKVISPKYIGHYKNDIIIEKDDAFVKIGERIVEITDVNDENISGRYYESYREGFEEYAQNKNEFTFEAKTQSKYDAEFQYTNSSGKVMNGHLGFDMGTGSIYFYGPENNGSYNGNFSRVFE